MSQPPRIHYPARREPDEPYATLDQVLACSDIPELDVRVDFWQVGGRGALLRVRGLDLVEQDRAHTAAARAVPAEDRERGVTEHWPTFAVTTLALGCVTPRVTPEQARAFLTRNGRAVELLVDLIVTLSSTSQERIDALFRETAGPLAADDGPAGDASAPDPAP